MIFCVPGTQERCLTMIRRTFVLCVHAVFLFFVQVGLVFSLSHEQVGLGFRVQGLAFRVLGLWARVQG